MATITRSIQRTHRIEVGQVWRHTTKRSTRTLEVDACVAGSVFMTNISTGRSSIMSVEEIQKKAHQWMKLRQPLIRMTLPTGETDE